MSSKLTIIRNKTSFSVAIQHWEWKRVKPVFSHILCSATYTSTNMEYQLKHENNIPCKARWYIYRDEAQFNIKSTMIQRSNEFYHLIIDHSIIWSFHLIIPWSNELSWDFAGIKIIKPHPYLHPHCPIICDALPVWYHLYNLKNVKNTF